LGKRNRRKFIKNIFKGSAVFAAYPVLADHQDSLMDLIESDDSSEKFWKKIRKQYTVSNKYINLNNAGVNPQPRIVQEAVDHYLRLSNEMPSYFMWQVIEKDKDLIKTELGRLLGCERDDLALMRNTSEAMETVIFGLPLNKGDEVVLSRHDYPHMKFAWMQREKRDGIILKWVEMDLPSTDAEYIVGQYAAQINASTKLVCITHITNWNGQVVPLKQLIELAKKYDAEVLVDAAHTVAQRPVNITDLNADYVASSLHKWLGAPFGTGILYIKDDKRAKLYPLLAGPNPKSKRMSKFEHSGTKNVAAERGILPAIVFHNVVGTERKMARLQFLKTYVADQIKGLPGINIQSPLDPEFGSVILLLSIDGVDNQDLINSLFKDWNIHVTMSNNEKLSGIRISPNIYTQLEELDTFVQAIKSQV